jgi:predicted metallopeptidase
MEALMSKKWERMTKNEKLDMLRHELDKLTRHIEGSLPTAKKAKKAAKKGEGDEEPPFST